MKPRAARLATSRAELEWFTALHSMDSLEWELERPDSPEGYVALHQRLRGLLGAKTIQGRPNNVGQAWAGLMRAYCRQDFYFFCRWILSTSDISIFESEFIFRRCREYEGGAEDVFNEWARGHGKSTIYAFAGPLWQLINNPELRIAIVSIKIANAEAHLRRIKAELESNDALLNLFPDVFYARPQTQSPTWKRSEITVRRISNMIEPSIMATGFLDSQPTGTHLDVLVLDDIVDRSNSRTVEAIQESQVMLEYLLKCTHGDFRMFCVGTRYRNEGPDGINDLWGYMIESGRVSGVRRYPAVDTSRPRPDLEDIGGGEPVLLSVEELRKQLGKGAFARRFYRQQYLLMPDNMEAGDLDPGMLQTYTRPEVAIARICYVYIFVDPAGVGKRDGAKSSKAQRDDSAVVTVGVDAFQNIYVLEIRSDLMSPTDRIRHVISEILRWRAHALKVMTVRIEETAISTDSHYLRKDMEAASISVPIERVTRGGGGSVSKTERLYESMEPLLSAGRVWVPKSMMRKRRGNPEDMVVRLREEIRQYATGPSPNVLDALSQIAERKTKTVSAIAYPRRGLARRRRASVRERRRSRYGSMGWMAA